MPNTKDELYRELDRLTDIGRLQVLTPGQKERVNELTTKLVNITAQEIWAKAVDKQRFKQTRKRVERKWKADEDWGNAKLGLKREGHLKRGVGAPDGTNEMFSVEYTRHKITFLEKEMRDAESHATQSRTPIVVVFQPDSPRNRGFVVLRFDDWVGLHGK